MTREEWKKIEAYIATCPPPDDYRMTVHPANFLEIIQAAAQSPEGALIRTRADLEAWLEAALDEGINPL